MIVLRLVALTLVGAIVAFPAGARNDVYTLPLQQTLDSPEFAQQVGSSVAFVFGDQPAPGGAIADYVANEREHFHDRTEEVACRATLIEALTEMRDRATSAGANAVVGIVSYFRKKTFSSPTEFECHAGSNGVFVSLKGTFVKLQR
jgi:uncharacterized protein YbjQ (UPF0145 family)